MFKQTFTALSEYNIKFQRYTEFHISINSQYIILPVEHNLQMSHVCPEMSTYDEVGFLMMKVANPMIIFMYIKEEITTNASSIIQMIILFGYIKFLPIILILHGQK